MMRFIDVVDGVGKLLTGYLGAVKSVELLNSNTWRES